MIFCENRFPPRIKFGAGFFGSLLLEHDLFRKPVPAIRDHALKTNGQARAHPFAVPSVSRRVDLAPAADPSSPNLGLEAGPSGSLPLSRTGTLDRKPLACHSCVAIGFPASQ